MTTRYIDFNRGSDASADPTNPLTPWQNLTMMVTVAAGPGDQFLLANDSTWEYDIATIASIPANWTGTKAAPVVIGRYAPAASTASADAKPVIKWNRSVDSGDWTYDGPNNMWAYDSGKNLGGSLAFVSLGGRIDLAHSAGSTALPLASVDGLFRVSGTTIQIYAPAETDPTTYYGGVVISPVGSGFINHSADTCYTQLDDLHFEESGAIFYLWTNNTNDCGLVSNRCSMANGGAAFSLQSATTNNNLDVVIDEYRAESFRACAIWMYSNGASTFRSVEIKNSRFSDGPHGVTQGQIYLQNKMLFCAVHDNLFEQAPHGSYSNPYDGCCLYAEAGSDNVVVKRNVFRDSHQAVVVNSGRRATIAANVFVNCNNTIQLSDALAVNSTDYVIDGNTCFAGANIPILYGFLIPSSCCRAYFNTASTSVALTIRNNVFYNIGALESPYLAGVTFEGTKTTGSYTLTIENNSIYDCTYGAAVVATQTEVATVGTISGDPLLDADYRPQDGSPLIEAGLHVAYGTDASGAQRWNPPTIGAYEYKPARTARV